MSIKGSSEGKSGVEGQQPRPVCPAIVFILYFHVCLQMQTTHTLSCHLSTGVLDKLDLGTSGGHLGTSTRQKARLNVPATQEVSWPRLIHRKSVGNYPGGGQNGSLFCPPQHISAFQKAAVIVRTPNVEDLVLTCSTNDRAAAAAAAAEGLMRLKTITQGEVTSQGQSDPLKKEVYKS